MTDFRKYDKVSRIGQADTDGILSGLVYIMPKLDGTNGSLWRENGAMRAGSRNRDLSIGSDNAGFCASMLVDDAANIANMRYPDWIIYGEWLVPHTIQGYKESAWRKFYVFAVWDKVKQRYLEPPEYWRELKDCGMNMVPYVIIQDPTAEKIYEMLEVHSTYLMQDGQQGEGIVLHNYEYVNKFGENKSAKVLCETFSASKKQKPTVVTDCVEEEAIASLCVSEHLVLKTRDKIVTEVGYWDSSLIGRLLETVWYDVVTEELYDALKKRKNPTLNMKKLKGLVCKKAKEFIL